MCRIVDHTKIWAPFQEFKPVNPDDARLQDRDDLREITESSIEYKELLEQASARDLRIKEIKKIGRERLALHRVPTNPVREFVKTTHDDDLTLDLHKHLKPEEREELAELTSSLSREALKYKLEVVFDTFKQTCYNKQYWIPKINLDNDVLKNPDYERAYLFWDTLIASVGFKGSEGKRNQYKYNVFTFLKESSKCLKDGAKVPTLDAKMLREIQEHVEKMSLNFDELEIHSSFKHLIKQIHAKAEAFREEMPVGAKYYLLKHLKHEGNRGIVNSLNPDILEGIAVWVLCTHYNPFNLEHRTVSIQTLVTEFDNAVWAHYRAIHPDDKEAAEDAYPICDDRVRTRTVDNEREDVDNEREDTDPTGDTNQKKDDSKKQRKRRKHRIYEIGSHLFDYLAILKVIEKCSSESINLTKKRKEKRKGGNKKGKDKYAGTPAYVRCTFQLDEMPIRVSLPMVYPPLEWVNRITPKQRELEESQMQKYKAMVFLKHKFVLWDTIKYRSLRRLCGGYLTSRKRNGYVKNNASLLSSRDLNNFDVHCTLGKEAPLAPELCAVVARLQVQGFRINVKFLNFLKSRWDVLRSYGLVMPEVLAYMDVTEALEKLRSMYHSVEWRDIRKNFQFLELSKLLLKNIQQASFEQATIKLAEAYSGYHFYLPVFLDFRGRNYRYGPFHLHERDLLRSLFLFVRENDILSLTGAKARFVDSEELTSRERDRFYTATAFHYAKYVNYDKAYESFKEEVYDPYMGSVESNDLEYGNIPSSLYKKVQTAKNPFQFLASTLAVLDNDEYTMRRIPITQDASASAYQLVSHLLTDPDTAIRTNLILEKDKEKDGRTITPENRIHDIYDFMLEGMIHYVSKRANCSQQVAEKIKETFDRKIMKMVFMPVIYGKTKKSTVDQFKKLVGSRWSYETICEVVDLCFSYWRQEFVDVCKVMELVKAVCGVTSKLGNNVVYGNDYFRTIQNYCVQSEVPLTVYYDRLKRKKSTVRLKENSNVKNIRKTMNSTFANFIHQKDACTVVNVLLELLFKEKRMGKIGYGIPIYTVHDNFLTTIDHVDLMPKFYRESIRKFGHPSLIMKQFIIDNVIIHALHRGLNEKNFKKADDWEYIVKYVIKSDPHLLQEYPEYAGEGEFPDQQSLDFRLVFPMEVDKYNYDVFHNKPMKERDKLLKNKHDMWVTPLYTDELNPIPRTVINKCIEFCIPNYKELPEAEKVNWKKSMARLNKAYAEYNRALFEFGGMRKWLDYQEGLADLEGRQDYCLHH